jgi:diguanylate cyclase (GGDEF)-like protein
VRRRSWEPSQGSVVASEVGGVSVGAAAPGDRSVGPSPPELVAGSIEDREREAWGQRRRDPVWALRLGEILRDEAVRAGDDVARGRALTIVGACHVAQNDFLAALRALLEARSALEGGPAVDRARALSEAGHVEATLGDPASGIELLHEAHRLYESAGDRSGCADTLNRIGIVFFGHGDLDEAQDAYERSLALRTTADDPLAVAGLRNNLAKVLTARSEHDAALEHLADARSRFAAAQEPLGVAMAVHNVAEVHVARGDHDRAVALLEEAIVGYDATGHVYGACEARTRLGGVRAHLGEVDEARSLLERAHEDAERVGLDRACAEAAEQLADLLEVQGRAAEALRWLRHLRTVDRQLFDEASEQRLRAMQVRLQLERFQQASVTDALTGLLNRRGLEGALADRIARVQDEGGDLALLLLDLDDFKRVNDDFSHSVGDEVLRSVARILRSSTRPTDVCARFGGEEFVVVLPGCDRERGGRVARELVSRVRGHPWPQVAEALSVTTSIGLATLAEVGDAAGLLDAADRALYAAKHAGKDRVRGVR